MDKFLDNGIILCDSPLLGKLNSKTENLLSYSMKIIKRDELHLIPFVPNEYQIEWKLMEYRWINF
jgi:hypothetical protein